MSAVFHPLFQLPHLGGSETVGLGDERNHVHLVLQGLHELHIHRTEPAGGHRAQTEIRRQAGSRTPLSELPVSERRDEVEAAVDSVVLDVLPVEAALVPEVLLKLLLDVVCDRPPAANHSTRFQSAVKPAGLLSGRAWIF